MKRILLSSLSALYLVAATPQAAEPQHNIVVGLDNKREAVRSVDLQFGRQFTFTVRDVAVFGSVKLCDTIVVPIATMQKNKEFAADIGRADPSKPCCTLTTDIGSAGRVLAIQPHAKHEQVTLILTELKRTSGELVTASYFYCNAGPKVELRNELVDRVSRATLVDATNKKQYNVVRVKNPGRGDSWLVADHGQAISLVHLGSNSILRTWVKFPAPTATKATLSIPGASAPFEDLSIAN